MNLPEPDLLDAPLDVREHKLTLALPASVLQQLRARMAAENTTIRALVLEALRRAGYAVPEGALGDRRRSRPRRP